MTHTPKRIAHLVGLRIPVPPLDYGGTEKVVADVSIMQAATLGHEVVVYATQDSNLIPFAEEMIKRLKPKLGIEIVEKTANSLKIKNPDGKIGSLILRSTGVDHIGMWEGSEESGDAAEKAFEEKADRIHADLIAQFLEDEKQKPYDIINSHFEHIYPEALKAAGKLHKTIETIHSELTDGYRGQPVIAISKSHEGIVRNEFQHHNPNLLGYAYHGWDETGYKPQLEHAGFLSWVGRFVDYKGPHRAIDIAKATNTPLIMAGVKQSNREGQDDYFDKYIGPNLTMSEAEGREFLKKIITLEPRELRKALADLPGKPPIIWVGPVTEKEKQPIFGKSMASLFPISWKEQFGLVMIESMACAAPVIATTRIGDQDCGSVREVIHNGATGFHIDAEDETDAVKKGATAVAILKAKGNNPRAEAAFRQTVRDEFDRTWTLRHSVTALEALYDRLLDKSKTPNSQIGAVGGYTPSDRLLHAACR